MSSRPDQFGPARVSAARATAHLPASPSGPRTEVDLLRARLVRGARYRAAWERAHEVADQLLSRPGGRDADVERALLSQITPDLRDELEDALIRRQLMRDSRA